MRILRCSATVTAIALIDLLSSDVSVSATEDTTHSGTDSVSQTSSVTIDHDELIRLPFRTVEEVIGLQNGTTVYHQKPGGEFSLNVPEISVRGSLPFETGYYLNGVHMNDPFSGYFTARISPHALERITLDPTSFGSQNGLSGSNAVQMTTRRGESRLSGMVESVSDNAFGSGFDQNWYTTSLGGPIPGVQNAYFFGLVERRYFGDRNPSSMTDDFLPGHPDRLRGNWLKGWSYNGRFDYEPRKNISITATIDGSITEWSEYIHAYYFDWQHLPYYKDENFDFSGRLHHRLTPTLEYSVQASYVNVKRFRGDGVYGEDLDAYRKPYRNYEADNYQLFYSWDDMYGPTPDFDEGHAWDDYLKYKTSQVDINGAVSKEIGRGNKIILGAEYRRYAIRMYQNLLPTIPRGFSGLYVNHFGYDIQGNEADDGGNDWGDEVRHPIEFGVNLAGKLRFGGLELNPGIRLDIFDYKSLKLKDVHRPFGDDVYLDLEDMTRVPARVRWSPRIDFRYALADFGLSVNGSYGLFYRPAPYSLLYSGWSFFAVRVTGGSFYPHSNPDAELSKERALQLGLAYSSGKTLEISLTGFHKEINNGTGIFFMSPAWPNSYDYFGRVDRRRVWGLEAGLNWEFANQCFLDLKHTWFSVETDGYGASTYNMAWTNPSFVGRPWHTADSEQPHSYSATFRVSTREGEGPVVAGVHPLERLTLFLTEETTSGFPYTPLTPHDPLNFYHVDREIPSSSTNSASSPINSVVNLMVEREFKTSGFSVIPFLCVRNLFDNEIVYHVYSGTGEPDNTGYLNTPEGMERTIYDDGPYDNSDLKFGERYELAQRDPLNYGAPRQILFGLRISF